jgi:putative addiction module component (TIGR02574 family)
MPADYKDVQYTALNLDEDQRAELAKTLINSLDKSNNHNQVMEDDLDQAWEDEIKRRKQDIQSGDVKPIAGEEVHKAARELLKNDISISS